MPPRPDKGEWTPGLLIVLLGASAILQLVLPGATAPPNDSILAPRRQRVPVAAMVPAYGAVLRAPIFAPDRKPGESPLGAGDAAAPSVQLIGVALAGRTASAVVRTSDGAVQALRPGQAVQGWRLVAVEADQATFVGPHGRSVVQLGAPAAPTGDPHSKSSASEAP